MVEHSKDMLSGIIMGMWFCFGPVSGSAGRSKLFVRICLESLILWMSRDFIMIWAEDAAKVLAEKLTEYLDSQPGVI